ncbi:hypothetical protein M8J75_013312 [Diaphorina citri]|nr:hypothetical protein M8J75_013312 [Diaphorina citri]
MEEEGNEIIPYLNAEGDGKNEKTKIEEPSEEEEEEEGEEEEEEEEEKRVEGRRKIMEKKTHTQHTEQLR